MSSFEIRTARTEDAKALSNIYAHYVLNTAVSFEYEAPDEKEFRRRIEKTLEHYPYIVAEEEGRIRGYAYAGAFNSRAAASWTAEASIYIAENKRRSGTGRALYARLEELLAAQHFQTLTVKVACCEREDEYLSRDSMNFHLDCGYRISGTVRRCGYKFGRWYDLCIMEKEIGRAENPEEIILFPCLGAV